ncbi:CheR family methyltransferase [Bacteroidota bacterium]
MKSEVEELHKIYQEKLNKNQFEKISAFINGKVGIKLPEEKLIMLQGRLYKRLKALNIKTFNEYFEYAFSKEGSKKEIVNLIDVICTNKTSFFREPNHFDFIKNHIFSEFINRVNGNRHIKIWSAGCSSGEEPYTLGMVFQSFIEKNFGFNYSILGTDISTQILKTAINAIYSQDKTQEIPNEIKKNYLLKSKDRKNPTVRVIPEIRRKVTFQRLNLMDNVYNVKQIFDIIFCRNTLIYFDRPIQELVINKLCQHLKHGGYLFIGHSESVFSMNVPLQQIRPTIYRKI